MSKAIHITSDKAGANELPKPWINVGDGPVESLYVEQEPNQKHVIKMTMKNGNDYILHLSQNPHKLTLQVTVLATKIFDEVININIESLSDEDLEGASDVIESAFNIDDLNIDSLSETETGIIENLGEDAENLIDEEDE